MELHLKRELQDLADGARDLLAATTDSAEDKVRQARVRLGEAMESSRDVLDRLTDRAGTAARAADGHLRDHPYIPVVVALGLGALLAAVLLSGKPSKR
jgi:ElaB/YqjD/DUF883 family membrane-anchored ribosome-binding protein